MRVRKQPTVRMPAAAAIAAVAPIALLMPELGVADLTEDHGWAEVTRVSTACITGPQNGSLRYADGVPFTEGRNRGWPGDAGALAYRFHPTAASSRSRWPYGCWFYLVRGSGIMVNAGRSLRAASRRDVHAQLGIPCADGGFCTAPPGDKLYCFLAERLGYDSIQVARSHFNGRPEMVVCRGKCMTVRVGGACPPLAMRATGRPPTSAPADSGGHLQGHCRCSRESALLNCGGADARTNCTLARSARAGMWHTACERGLYRRCVSM